MKTVPFEPPSPAVVMMMFTPWGAAWVLTEAALIYRRRWLAELRRVGWLPDPRYGEQLTPAEQEARHSEHVRARMADLSLRVVAGEAA
ncbi:MAG: hypothetical protein GC129_07295 [Proteobacteria bacterium]|nr:hypothetical protein [Pseudomonadota bacterium]